MLHDSYSEKEVRDDLKIQLKRIEAEEQKLQDEIERLERDKKKILTQLSEHSNENYEQNMLQLVYEQRHKK